MITITRNSIKIVLSLVIAVAFLGCEKETDLLSQEIATIDQQLDAAGVDYVKDPSGVRIEYLTKTTSGRTPTIEAIVEIDYSGKIFYDGVEFDSGEKVDLPLWETVEGFQIGLQLMKEGETAKIYIPSVLGYGSFGASLIPPNTIIQFEVTLYDLK